MPAAIVSVRRQVIDIDEVSKCRSTREAGRAK